MNENTRARRIACSWHGGQSSPLYALCSSGAIVNYTLISDEIADCAAPPIETTSDTELSWLQDYVDRHGVRGPVAGWGKLV